MYRDWFDSFVNIFESENIAISMATKLFHFFNDATAGLFAPLLLLLPILLIYHKSNDIMAVYMITIVASWSIKNTILSEMDTVLYYIVVLALTLSLYGFIKGRN